MTRCATLLIACLMALTGTAAPARAPVSELNMDAGSGRVVFARDAARRRPPASLVKMMTLLLAFEAIDAGRLRMDDMLRMTVSGARQPPSRLGMAAGQRIPVRTALKAIVVISANDVAVALAERLAGSERAFVAAMNRRAASLGMTGTRFVNPTGLTGRAGGGISTARDLAVLARRLVARYPDRYPLFATRSIRWHGQVRPSHNRLLGRVPGVDGIKTGYTVPAGFNLAASARHGGRRTIVVVLGAPSAAARDLRVANLLQIGSSALPPRAARPRRPTIGHRASHHRSRRR